MEINSYIFRAYDIRGLYKKDLDEDLFRKIGFVLGKKSQKFLVGNDIRKSGKSLTKALIEGLLAVGAKVIYSGTTSFGETLFAGWKIKTDKILFVTASHLPPEWNGLKMYYGDGEPFSEDEIKKLRDQVIKLKPSEIKKTHGKFKKIDIEKEYIEFFLKRFRNIKNSNLRVVIDCGNGSTSIIAPKIFRKMGFDVIELYCQPNSNFPNRSSEPKQENVRELIKRVKKEKADFGIAFDGDGDRGAIVDNKGRYLNGNQIGIILGKHIIPSSKKKKVVKAIACSLAIEEELRPLGAKIIEVPVGHTYIISGCKKHKAALGMEETSHMVMPEYFLFDDAILIPLKIAEIILKSKKNLSEMVDNIKIYPYEEIVFACPDDRKFEIIKKLTTEFKKEYGGKVNDLDGAKISFPYGWVLIRPANTSPKIRLYVEAKTKEKFNLLKQKFTKILKEKICKQ
ncbi:phosphomannomutase/phosphoglucomutase [Patescibacteria group bacterium]|nr:phosphomannomutase/phosphoglucomutase [Patescibacteria group bacterium]MBU1876934.1 phosphomannomutase/phosphoglucomutase [Patescibacteria group bacterium]